MTPALRDDRTARIAAVVYNPIKIDLDLVRRSVADAERSAGWGETLWFETSEDDPGQGAATAAREAGADMIIAAGGDGTVRAVAEAVAGGDVSLALLPSGTGNLLARNLHLTLDDVEHALEAAFSGEDRRIDLGRIEIRHGDRSLSEHAYVVMAGLGMDAEMLAATDDDLKKKIGWLAYVTAIVKVMADENRLRLRYRIDDRRVKSVNAHTIIAGNCGLLTGNVLLLPEAAIDDGVLDIVILRPEGFLGWAQILGKVLFENGLVRRLPWARRWVSRDADALNYKKGSRLTVRLSRPQKVELDGDEFGDAVAMRTWIDPGALTVRVPAR